MLNRNRLVTAAGASARKEVVTGKSVSAESPNEPIPAQLMVNSEIPIAAGGVAVRTWRRA